MKIGAWVKVVAVVLIVAVLAVGNYLLNPRKGEALEAVEQHAQEESYRIGIDDVARLEPFLWVDARPIEVFEDGHAPRAANLSPEWFEDQLEGFFDRWRPDFSIVVYCDGADCRASDEIAARLRRALGENGADRVYVLKGGWQEYLKSGRKVEQ